MPFLVYATRTLTRLRRACVGIPGRTARFASSRLPRLFRLALIVAAGWAPLCALAQQTPVPPQAPVKVASDRELPDAPGLAASSDGSGYQSAARNAAATIAGTVLDSNGAEIQDARVVLSNRAGAQVRILQTSGNGEFVFAGLPSGTFRLTVTGQGMGTYVSPEIKVNAGDFRIVTQVMLPVAAATSEVTVVGDREELAEQQVQIAVQQRVMGVFPNFYSTYEWNAPPLGPKQKFQLAFRAVTDPVDLLGAGIIAGYEQGHNLFPGYGQGVQGYAKRFGAAYANDVSGRMLGSALFPTLFHQDPRYFYRGSGSVRSRALYAIAAAFIAKGDNGHWQPNYSHVLGNFAAGGLSNLYYPSGSRGWSLCVANGLIETAGNAGTNLLREFFLRGLTSKVPSYANGKP